jgi:hypothetical protein
VVLTIDNSKPNTKLNKIAVVVKEVLAGISTYEMPIETIRTFDLQGREVKSATKGLVVEQVRMADGTVKNVKVIRK